MKRYRFRSSRSIGEKATVAGGWGSLGRSYGGYFTHKLSESDMEKYSKLVLLRFCVFMRVVMLPAYRFVSNGTRLGMDGYLLWLLAVVQSCYSFWECFPCCSLAFYSVDRVLMLVGPLALLCRMVQPFKFLAFLTDLPTLVRMT